MEKLTDEMSYKIITFYSPPIIDVMKDLKRQFWDADRWERYCYGRMGRQSTVANVWVGAWNWMDANPELWV